MYKRSELRHSCFRAKKGTATEENKKVLESIEPLLKVGQTFKNFSDVWDILIDPKGKIVIIKPEVNYDYIHSTCIEASLYKKQGIDFDSFDDRQMNIITIVESQMLEGVTSWENYNRIWGVEVDKVLKFIKTKVFKATQLQIEVTEEMINASMKEEVPVQVEETPVQLSAELMSQETKNAFEEFLAKKYKKE